MPAYRVHSKTGKAHRCNGVSFGVDSQVVDPGKLGWTKEQIAEFLSDERSMALSIEQVDGGLLRKDGPTLEEFVAAGYKAEDYPPPGFTFKRSPAAGAHLLKDRAAREAGKVKPWAGPVKSEAKPEPAKSEAAEATPAAEPPSEDHPRRRGR